MATNKIESLDPALIRPGRIDRKIEFPLPDIKTKRRIFGIHTVRGDARSPFAIERDTVFVEREADFVAVIFACLSAQFWFVCVAFCFWLDILCSPSLVMRHGCIIASVCSADPSVFPPPSAAAGPKRHLLTTSLHSASCILKGRMTLADDVDLEVFIMAKDELSGADIKAICTESGLLALRERRMKVLLLLLCVVVCSH